MTLASGLRERTLRYRTRALRPRRKVRRFADLEMHPTTVSSPSEYERSGTAPSS